MDESAEAPRPAEGGPTRREVPRGERILCAVLLALIPVAAAGVWAKGRHYNARLHTLDASLVRAASRSGPAPADVLRDPGEEGARGRAAAPAAAVPGAPPVPGFAVPGVPPGAMSLGSPPALPDFPDAGLPPAGLAPIAPPSPGGAPGSQGSGARASVWASSFGDPSWIRTSAVQRFGPRNLHEKLGGRAEQYLHHGVVTLETATYGDQRDGEHSLDAFVYNMGTSANAFGIYAAERPRGAKPVVLGDQGCRAETSCFFTRGRYYVQVVASGRGTLLEAAALKLARQIDSGLAATSTPAAGSTTAAQPAGLAAQALAVQTGKAPAKAQATPAVKPRSAFDTPEALLSLLPKESAIPESSQYLTKDALGLGFLAGVATQKYRVVDTDYTLFLTRRASETEARAIVGKYVEFLGGAGKVQDRRDEGGVTYVVGTVNGSFDALFRAGPFIGGAHCAADRAVAAGLVVKLLHSLAAKVGSQVPDAAGRLERWPGAGPGNGSPRGASSGS